MVLDPFMGSGTTAEACIRTGRDYVGFEVDPVYYEGCLRRIAEANEDVHRGQSPMARPLEGFSAPEGGSQEAGP